MANVIQFETPERSFLRSAVGLIQKLKGQINRKIREQIIIEIDYCVKKYEGKIPDYYSDIIWHLKKITSENIGFFEQNELIDEVSVYLQLVTAPFSPSIFYEMVKRGFNNTFDCPIFTEAALMEIISDMKNTKHTMQPIGETSCEDFSSMFNSDYCLRKHYWSALAKMRNASENVLFAIIENAEAEFPSFYEVAQSIIVAGNTTEAVLGALLYKISQIKCDDKYDILKNKLYYFALFEGKTTEKIVSDIITLAKPKGSEYYALYYLIAKKYCNNSRLIKQKLIDKLDEDEEKMGSKYKAARRKLNMLLKNGAHS